MTLAKALAAAAGNAGEAVYIDDAFSTYLYTGNGSTQTITNNIDLATEGGMVWIKARSVGYNHVLFDTARGGNYRINSNTSDPQGNGATSYGYISSFGSTGFTAASGSGGAQHVNETSTTYASWTFRKAEKFFDVVTWTGNTTSTAGTVYRQLSHSLGSAPGTIIVKNISTAKNWPVYHRSLPTSGNAGGYLFLNTTGALNYTAGYFPTAGYVGSNGVTAAYNSTVFTAGEDINQTGNTYVAYLFAHNAGGFGADGSENVISCGSFTTDGSGNATVNLGYEPQWYLIKRTDVAQSWFLLDTMRGWTATANTSKVLIPNLANAESTVGSSPTATGFTTDANLTNASATYIYIAIRRPMKPPESGTEVFGAQTWTGGSTTFNTFPADLATRFTRTANYSGWKLWGSRLQGQAYLNSINTNSETADTIFTWNAANNGTTVTFGATDSLVNYYMRRAPGFFDVVCYTGNGTAGRTINHNLGATPELMIVKARDYSGGRPWPVYAEPLGNTNYLYLNQTDASTANPWWNDTTPTSTVFTVGSNSVVNYSGTNYVAYLFATYPGVSKCTAFTGTGTLQTINCGFTSGARFVLIKRTDSTGDWYVWDSARGISSSNDPYLLLNSTAAEVTTTNWVDTASTGFQLTAAAGNNVNINGASYIVLAIA